MLMCMFEDVHVGVFIHVCACMSVSITYAGTYAGVSHVMHECPICTMANVCIFMDVCQYISACRCVCVGGGGGMIVCVHVYICVHMQMRIHVLTCVLPHIFACLVFFTTAGA